MQKTLLVKIILISALSLLLLIPLGMIDGKVSERMWYRDSVQREISESWTGSQTLRGPLLVVPYVEKIRSRVWDKELEKYVDQVNEYEKKLYFFPQQLDIDIDVNTEERYRGIYSVPVYTAVLRIAGDFFIPAGFDVETERDIAWQGAFLSLGVGDVRGIRDGLNLTWQGQQKSFTPGSGITSFAHGVHADLAQLHSASERTYRFDINLRLAGTDGLNVIPAGENTRVNMHSPWPHPGFTGRFLPESRNVSERGFEATWGISHFSTNIQDALHACTAGECAEFENRRFGVSFLQPVDVYSLTDRAIKYGILFISLTFGVFFLFEILKKLAIHPVQYGLVGLALAVFYQLLISLSEHMLFDIAYLIAALASITLITFYVCFVLRSVMRGLWFGGALSLLYGMLLMILKSEDHSLLMGSVLVFTALAIAMFLTRKVDWYKLGEK
jgi:inner membrane protein